MAEISEEPPESTHQTSQSDLDPKTIRKTKPGLKRLTLTLSVLICFIFAFPFLWKSVEIHRAPLPFREIDSLSSQIGSNPFLLFPCHFQAIFVAFDDLKPQKQALESSILRQMTKLTSKTPTSKCGTLNDNGVDEVLAGVLSSGEKVYSVVVVNRESEELRAVVGKYRHAWVVGRVSETEAAEKAAEIFVNVFVNGGKEEGFINGEFMPVGADGRIVLSFNLLNSNPLHWVYDWYEMLF
uniref:Uncharacterized protein n=1 Tax=Fagus sylvatica TaxID=28930 RepID=A0A2N9I2Y2_FAGSY